MIECLPYCACMGAPQRPKKFPERPVHWTWLHGATAPTADQLAHGPRAEQTRAAREATQERLARLRREWSAS